MDIHDINLKFGISLRKLRRMEKAGVLRVGKSELPRHWQMVRFDLQKGKLSALSLALAYRYPQRLSNVVSLNARHRKILDDDIRSAELRSISCAIDSEETIFKIIIRATKDGGDFLDDFVDFLQDHIPEKPVTYAYVAVRILLMCKNEWDMESSFRYLRDALSKAKASPKMTGWWHSEQTAGTSGRRTIYHRPYAGFDL